MLLPMIRDINVYSVRHRKLTFKQTKTAIHRITSKITTRGRAAVLKEV